MPFQSKDQWRWAFSHHKRWAHKSRPFKTLPKNKRKGR